MAYLAQQDVSGLGGTITGAGGTLLLRDQIDQTGTDSLFRPSVMYGLGTGLAGVGAYWLSDTGRLNLPPELKPAIGTHGLSALVSGTFSALYPKGSTTATLPSTVRSGTGGQ